MCHQGVYFSSVLCVILAFFIQDGHAIQCWKCNSETDVTCNDYFNVTRIRLNQQFISNNYNYGNQRPAGNYPHLEFCDEMHTSSQVGQYKNVCLKRIMTAPSGTKIVNRECRMVRRDLKEGTCPDDITSGGNSRNLYYCGTCDYDGCNGANGLKTSLVLTGLVPAVLLLLRK